MGFSRQEYWSGLPCPSPEYILNKHIIIYSVFMCVYIYSVFMNVFILITHVCILYFYIAGEVWILQCQIFLFFPITFKNYHCWRRSKDGGGIGQGDHFLPHKFIKRTFKHWVNSIKQLLNAGRGHQAPRKAAHCLRKEVRQNIKDKKWDKRGRDGAPSRERSFKNREVSKHQETP